MIQLKRYLAVFLTISLILMVLPTYIFAADNDISYGDYQTTYFSNLRSPFRDSNGYDKEIVINEKYQQPRLWSANDTHQGIDLSSPKGTPAYPVWKSKVTYKSPAGTPVKNNYVILQLDLNSDGVYTENVYAVYMHMLTINVNVGDQLEAINQVGTTGYFSDDPSQNIHLHFGLTNNSSSTYSSLVWTPSYNFFKYSSLYNYGKDFDYLYNYIPPSVTNSDIKISGYHKPNSTQTRNTLEYMRIYYRPAGSTGSWSYKTMDYLGSFNYKIDVYSLGAPGNQIEYFFVGKAPNSDSYYAKVGYHPAKYDIPPLDPNSQTWAYSKYTYTIPSIDSFEPNETQGTAKSISRNYSYLPTIHKYSDIDWYVVYASSGTLNISMSSIPANTDYDLYLYDSYGGLLASSTAGGNTSELISYLVTNGNYYIKVLSYYGCNSSDTYLLKTY